MTFSLLILFIWESNKAFTQELEKLRTNKEDLKKKMNEEKAKARAAQTLHVADYEESSFSSSSKSSDGEERE